MPDDVSREKLKKLTDEFLEKVRSGEIDFAKQDAENLIVTLPSGVRVKFIVPEV